MSIMVLKRFSKIYEEDFHEGLSRKRKKAKEEKAYRTLGGGVVGLIAGTAIGGRSPKGGLIGAGIGSLVGGKIGHVSGKRHVAETEKDIEKYLRRFKGANKEEKKYLLRRLREEENRDLMEAQLRAQRATAWNTL